LTKGIQLKNGRSVASTAYIMVLGVTTIKVFANITYVEDPTPRVFIELSAETRRFTPDTIEQFFFFVKMVRHLRFSLCFLEVALVAKNG
jgi:hypothetical protein